MYRINDTENNIEKIDVKSFAELSYRERDNLQEWIAKNPDVFGEELLIIQKEFNKLIELKEQIEADFGDVLECERLDDKKVSRIKYQRNNLNCFNEEDWSQIVEFMTDSMVKLVNGFKTPLIADSQELLLNLDRNED